MKIQFIEELIDYDGSQLVPHWILKTTGLKGNAAVAFIGRCEVKQEHMVDLVDLKEGKTIFSERMLHFLVELFDSDLNRTILLQRLFVSLVQQEIMFRTQKPTLVRAGNDLYEGDAKLSVSVATASPVSTLIHYGINIKTQNAPIKTKGLEDFNLEPTPFAKSILETFRHELETLEEARSKVKPVIA